MSFVSADDIKSLVEELLVASWPQEDVSLSVPFPRMSYEQAISQYGSDKPDTRFEMKVGLNTFMNPLGQGIMAWNSCHISKYCLWDL